MFSWLLDRLRRRRDRLDREEQVLQWRRFLYRAKQVEGDMIENPNLYPDEECPFYWGDN